MPPHPLSFSLLTRWLKYLLITLPLSGLLWSNQERPNIVWLTTEDNSANWYRLYNDNGVSMPNVERLAKEGLVFERAISNAPVCSTARSTIISGTYVSRLGAQYHRRQEFVKLPEGLQYFPAYLREAGYHTTNNSKTDYNFIKSYQDAAWDASSRKASFKDRRPGQPFFHVQNFATTHEGRLFKDNKEPVSPEALQNIKLFPYHPDTPLMRSKYAQYHALHKMVDNQMGNIIDELEGDGLLDDTFIFHFGDHGGVLPGSKGYARHDGLRVAMVVYIPEKWKHLSPAPRGSRVDTTVEFVDLAATVLNLAGLPIPEQIDGKPFLGQGVTAQELTTRDEAIAYAERFDEKIDMVRTLYLGDFQYIRNYQPFNYDGLHNDYRYKQPAFEEWRTLYQEGKLNDAQSAFFKARPSEELYDLSKDPHGVVNLATDSVHSKTLLLMRSRLQERLKDLPDLGFFPESRFLTDSGLDGARFGKQKKQEIAKYIDVADLQLLPFAQAKPLISEALNSQDPIMRYWALIPFRINFDKVSVSGSVY